VNVQVLLNSLRLERKPAAIDAPDTRAIEVSAHHKSTHFYRRALLSPAAYRKLVRGQVDLRGIIGQFRRVVGARLLRTTRRLLRLAPNEYDLLAQMKQLATRGTDTLVIVGAEDPARDYMEFHLGKNGSGMRSVPRFRFVVVDGADHTLSDRASRRVVIDLVLQHLDRGRDGSPSMG
jgi:hypothetical protein